MEEEKPKGEKQGHKRKAYSAKRKKSSSSDDSDDSDEFFDPKAEISTDQCSVSLPKFLIGIVPREKWDLLPPMKQKQCQKIMKCPNSYFFRFRPPWETPKFGTFSADEDAQFFKRLNYFKESLGLCNTMWGLFAVPFPGRVGYQLSTYYRAQVKNGRIVDPNLVLDQEGIMKQAPKKTKNSVSKQVIQRLNKEAIKVIFEQLEASQSQQTSNSDFDIATYVKLDSMEFEENPKLLRRQQKELDKIQKESKLREESGFPSYRVIVQNLALKEDLPIAIRHKGTRNPPSSTGIPNISEEAYEEQFSSSRDSSSLGTEQSSYEQEFQPEQKQEKKQEHGQVKKTEIAKSDVVLKQRKRKPKLPPIDENFSGFPNLIDKNEPEIQGFMERAKQRQARHAIAPKNVIQALYHSDTDSDDDSPLRGAMDPVTLRPMRHPAINEEGYVMDYDSWFQILKGTQPMPFETTLNSLSDLTMITAKSYESIKNYVVNIPCV